MSIVDGPVQSAIVLQISRVIVKFVPGLQFPQTEAAEAQHAAAHGEVSGGGARLSLLSDLALAWR